MCCAAAAAAKPRQSCPTLCDPTDGTQQAPLSLGFSRQEYWNGLPCSPPGDLPNSGIEPMSLMSPALTGGFFTTSAACSVQLSHVPLFATPGTAARQASLSITNSRS